MMQFLKDDNTEGTEAFKDVCAAGATVPFDAFMQSRGMIGSQFASNIMFVGEGLPCVNISYIKRSIVMPRAHS